MKNKNIKVSIMNESFLTSFCLSYSFVAFVHDTYELIVKESL